MNKFREKFLKQINSFKNGGGCLNFRMPEK